jgi:acetoin utilization deacetylase AcuC-like enzyme
MLPFRVIYHEDYDLHLGAHVFPSQKFRLIRDALLADGVAGPEDFIVPDEADDADVLRAHTAAWVDKLRHDKLSLTERMRLEIPYSPETFRAFWLAAGGSILAGQRAVEDGFAANLTGGFHHAYAGHGEGFCMIHDVAIAIRRLQADGAIRTAMVVDTDVHQGNGTAAIFSSDRSVFTLSIHQENNYPVPKELSDLDIGLENRIADEKYLARLEKGLVESLEKFQPDIAFYVGGADPYREDQLGDLSLTIAGLEARDRLVFEQLRRRGVPIAMTLAGGYARRVQDTVRIHVNAIRVAAEIARGDVRSTLV